MDPVLFTPRLKLTLITHAERDSDELTWLHELRSNKQTTAWSIRPPSISIEDTEKVVGIYLPDTTPAAPPPGSNPPPTSGEECARKAYKMAFAVHEILPPAASNAVEPSTRFIGLVKLVSLSGDHLPIPPHLVISQEQEKDTLVVELAYSLLPLAWGKGYATEAITAVLNACRSSTAMHFWAPWRKVWMRVIVNGRNAASLNVMRKLKAIGVQEKGVYKWKGESIFIGGEWRTEEDLYIFGGYLKG
ncbi:hypothetical protein BU25DRAFT_408156 [Macroventuria anomochaeta]|uniref:Uncharacterized protein n=1 Tax=Macroventuria anomochaeta TaxID=301207 RepID=A0ACB6SA19_9PLEO|nr:uncharacterized protein BU25DRAFT_408156 [Macroventuria anomochaeta]KAF2630888.1 hypothetical protein BU25DRAFT_408156 [Macroventuria anomochaeta]